MLFKKKKEKKDEGERAGILYVYPRQAEIILGLIREYRERHGFPAEEEIVKRI